MPFQQRTGTDLRGEHFNENLIRSLKEASHLLENNIKLNTIGNLEKLPQSAQKILDVINKTKDNK
jgi:undecaprenyl pyrophosphate synthase